MRAETGPMRFGDDWSGVFVRGDDCAGCLVYLQTVLMGNTSLSAMDRMYLNAVVGILSGSREPVEDVQQMKPIEECVVAPPRPLDGEFLERFQEIAGRLDLDMEMAREMGYTSEEE